MTGTGKIELEVVYGETFFQVDCGRCHRRVYLRDVSLPGPTFEEAVALAAQHHRCPAFHESGLPIEEARKGWSHGQRSDPWG